MLYKLYALRGAETVSLAIAPELADPGVPFALGMNFFLGLRLLTLTLVLALLDGLPLAFFIVCVDLLAWSDCLTSGDAT